MKVWSPLIKDKVIGKRQSPPRIPMSYDSQNCEKSCVGCMMATNLQMCQRETYHWLPLINIGYKNTVYSKDVDFREGYTSAS